MFHIRHDRTDGVSHETQLRLGPFSLAPRRQNVNSSGLAMLRPNSLHPNDQSYAHHTFVAANRKPEPFRLEHRLRRPRGEYRWVTDAAGPRFRKDGRFLGYIGSVIGITERKGVEDS